MDRNTILHKPLPIDSLLPRILSELENGQNLVVQATPGSGKTTRIPPALLKASFLPPEDEIWVLVPRRLAAKMGALRVAEEMGEEIGEAVGYQFRFEKVTGPRTRLKFLTEGMLIRLLIHSPHIPRASVVILDEFHERHLHSDVALSYLRRLQQQRRPDLKLLIMSATLDAESLSEFLGKCPIVRLDMTVHPVEISYLPSPPREPLEILVRKAVRQARGSSSSGDTLVFLPGMMEIRRCEESLRDAFKDEWKILPLHGELPREQQALIFKKFDRPKLVLATNVAETSLTIDGVTTVIDSGLHRQASFSWWSGVPALKTRPIPKASAIQRAGRAGRTGPGRTLRLYTQSDYEGRPSFDPPEIRRADLSETVLEIKALGITSLGDFPWFEAPPPPSLEACVDLLFHLGALERNDIDSPLTDLGKKMAEIPLHPRLSRMVIEAEKKKVLGDAALLAALISEDELDQRDALSVLESCRPGDKVERIRRRILSFFKFTGSSSAKGDLPFCLLTGFPDRVAKKRERGNELVFSMGGSGTVPAGPPVDESDTFVILDVEETQRQDQTKSKVHIRSLCPIRPEWLLDLAPSYLEEHSELFWDEKTGRVIQLSQIKYGQISLSESREKPKDFRSATDLFLKAALDLDLTKEVHGLDPSALLRALGKLTDPDPLEDLFARLRILGDHKPDFKSALPKGTALAEWIRELFQGEDLSLSELKRMDWNQRILGRLSHKILSSLTHLLPAHLILPRGRKVKIHYPLDQKPWMASRLQDFFGMKEGPKLMDGRISLTLHLLAPNQRPVQVTDDLASFWKNTYPQIRRELGRKYPKHAWPEDPLK